MGRRLFTSIVVAVCLGAAIARAAADDEPLPGPFSRIRIVDLKGEIDAMQRAYLIRRLDAAREDGVECIVLRIESPGGAVLEAKEMGEALLDLPPSIRTIAWI